jgi:hypothetical protein
MQHRSYPTQPGTPTPPAAPATALHLRHGWWTASCADCGHELARSRDQEAAERTGERRRCPVCRPEDADAPVPSDDDDWITVPHYIIPGHPELQDQLDGLVEWIAANGGFDQEPS